MTKKLSKLATGIFEKIRQIDENGNEFWSARDLSKTLDYKEFRNFIPVIEKAKEACKLSKHRVSDHIVEMHDMIGTGKGTERQLNSFKLSRYACYLIVQNANQTHYDVGKKFVKLFRI